jgi:DNA-binding XRE family transcriptional regulator
MSQQELAERIGVTRQQINHYSNNRRIMTLHVAKNIAFILQCDIDDLYEWIPVKSRSKRR